MKWLIRTCFAVAAIVPAFVSGQISGVVNIYTNVSAISGVNLTVGSSVGFSATDRVLVIQMKGADVDETNTSAFGDILDYHSAGNYEFATVASVTGTIVTLTLPLCRTYETTGHVQLIRVPQYTDVTVSGTLTADPWDGTTGGVVVIEATGTVTLNADVNVDGQGFRGGSRCNGYFACGDAAYKSNFTSMAYGSCTDGQKGEAIAEVPSSEMAARGKLANGGGGSNTGQHGGSGGGNFGAGGRSAYQWTGCFPYDDIWADGALALDYSDNRLYFGGGGGGGQQDNGLSVTDGSSGGGIIIIKAAAIDGSGNTISAKGNDVTIITDSEGAGAAGAGGSVLLLTDDMPSALTIDVSGGGGGNITSTLWAGTCHGPGGGGGGGYIGISLSVMPGTVTTILSGGPAGIITSPGAFCDGTTHGAENGVDGGIVTDIPALFDLPVIDLGNDTTLCVGLDPYVLNAGSGYASYLWSDGTTDSTIDITTDGDYWVLVTNAFGCAAGDTLTVDVLDAPVMDLPDTIYFCQGSSEDVDAGAGFTSYDWSTGATSESITITAPGNYICTVTNANGCSLSDTVVVPYLYPNPVVDLGEDTVICWEDIINLDAENAGAAYAWQDGSTDETFTVTGPGQFTVTVTDVNNCSSTDAIVVSQGCSQDIYIPNAFSPNGDGMNDEYNVIEFNNTIINYEMQIFNRWGELVFSTDDFSIGWNGTYRGKDAEMATYVRVITYDLPVNGSLQQVILKGNVTLIR